MFSNEEDIIQHRKLLTTTPVIYDELNVNIYLNFQDKDLKEYYEKFHPNKEDTLSEDSNFDLFFPNDLIIRAKSTVKINLDVKVMITNNFDKPEPFFLIPKNSISKTPLRLSNSISLIDKNYRDTIKIAVDNISEEDFIVKKYSRLFQIVNRNLDCFKWKNINSFDK